MARWVIISWYLFRINPRHVLRLPINVRKLVPLSALDDVVQDEDHAIVGGLEDQDILVLALLVVDDLLDLEGHGLAGPHVGDLAEPAICRYTS